MDLEGQGSDGLTMVSFVPRCTSRPVYRQLTFCQLCPPMIHMGTAELANVQGKVAEAVARVKQYVETEVIETSDGLDVRWRLQPEYLREDAQFDGFYCVLTNEVETQAPMQAIFRTYKEQSKVGRRFRMVKQPPIQVRPVWLHQPQRIESLVFVVMMALFVFALIEREARRVVKESGQVFTGLRPEGRDKLPVTAGRLFEAFAPLSLVKQRMRVAGEVIDVLTPATLSPIQAQVLDRLGLMKPVSYLQPTITPHPT